MLSAVRATNHKMPYHHPCSLPVLQLFRLGVSFLSRMELSRHRCVQQQNRKVLWKKKRGRCAWRSKPTKLGEKNWFVTNIHTRVLKRARARANSSRCTLHTCLFRFLSPSPLTGRCACIHAFTTEEDMREWHLNFFLVRRNWRCCLLHVRKRCVVASCAAYPTHLSLCLSLFCALSEILSSSRLRLPPLAYARWSLATRDFCLLTLEDFFLFILREQKCIRNLIGLTSRFFSWSSNTQRSICMHNRRHFSWSLATICLSCSEWPRLLLFSSFLPQPSSPRVKKN